VEWKPLRKCFNLAFNIRIRKLFFDVSCQSAEEIMEVAEKSASSGEAVDVYPLSVDNILAATYRALFRQELEDGAYVNDLIVR
jgi:hypothetical protein